MIEVREQGHRVFDGPVPGGASEIDHGAYAAGSVIGAGIAQPFPLWHYRPSLFGRADRVYTPLPGARIISMHVK
jgi:hypothetical protein